jgi:hypothetical protein
VQWTLGRLGAQGRACLTTVRLRHDVARLLGEVCGDAASPPLLLEGRA